MHITHVPLFWERLKKSLDAPRASFSEATKEEGEWQRSPKSHQKFEANCLRVNRDQRIVIVYAPRSGTSTFKESDEQA